MAQASDASTITFSLPDAPSTQQLATPRNRTAGYRPYPELIQSSLRDARCRNAMTQSDNQDVEVRFWIAARVRGLAIPLCRCPCWSNQYDAVMINRWLVGVQHHDGLF